MSPEEVQHEQHTHVDGGYIGANLDYHNLSYTSLWRTEEHFIFGAAAISAMW